MTENPKICTWLDAFAAGDLALSQQNKYKDHLQECSECRLAWSSLSEELNNYKSSSRIPLPAHGLSNLQEALDSSSPGSSGSKQTLRFATAAIIALIMFTSGFFMGRQSADQPLSTVLSFPRLENNTRQMPPLPRPSFSVARAESIPVLFYPQSGIPH